MEGYFLIVDVLKDAVQPGGWQCYPGIRVLILLVVSRDVVIVVMGG